MEKYKERALHGGVQRLYRFDNGHGASVICHSGSYGGGEGLWELAVIHYTDGDKYVLNYSTDITNDVIGHQTEEEIEALLIQIKALPSATGDLND